MTARTRTAADPDLPLRAPAPAVRWIPEPVLAFAGGTTAIDPRVGIALAGPKSYGTPRHPNPVNVGFIGTGPGVEMARQYLEKIAEGVDGTKDHHPFPGFRSDRGFRTDLRTGDDLEARVSSNELRSVMAKGKKQKDRFDELLGILVDRLAVLCDRDHPLDCVYVVLPEDVYKRCRVADYTEDGRTVHRDLRAAFKAAAMRYRMPTQILRESTTGLVDESSRALPEPAGIAWNLSTGLYFKANGFPWGPVGLEPGTCFVGVSFYRPLGESSSLNASVAQAFSESGDAFVLRGNEFTWQGRAPHLPPDNARRLIDSTLDRYRREYGRPPRHVVVHKRSWFHPDEVEGFQDALAHVDHDLVSLRWGGDVRLLRHGQYPPPRGTVFDIGDRHYLYPTGTMPELGYYPHAHVPAPLQVVRHAGDSPPDRILSDVLLLTKMNWNSAKYAEREPITTKFANHVGEVLKEVGPDRPPEAKYSFYM
jgi:hypothetical protein